MNRGIAGIASKMNSPVETTSSSDPVAARSPGASKVAVIMRTKDRPLLLARGLASVLSQNYSDWLLCLVNDGGPPEEVDAVVDRFRPVFGSRLQVIHHPTSRGMEAASNSAIAATNSTYVVVHDDDDAWHPDFLAETVAFLDSEANTHFGGVVTWSELVRERIEGQQILTIGRSAYNCWYTSIDLHRLLGGNTIPTMCFLYRRSILEEVGGYSETLSVLGDWDFNIRCVMAADIGVIPRVLAYYHQRDALASGAYGNSIETDRQSHDKTGALLRNQLLRQHLRATPSDLGNVAAASRGFVGIIDRLNEIEAYLASRMTQTTERVQQLEQALSPPPGQDRLANVERRLEAIDGKLELLPEIARRLRILLMPARVLARIGRAIRRLLRGTK